MQSLRILLRQARISSRRQFPMGREPAPVILEVLSVLPAQGESSATDIPELGMENPIWIVFFCFFFNCHPFFWGGKGKKSSFFF